MAFWWSGPEKSGGAANPAGVILPVGEETSLPPTRKGARPEKSGEARTVGTGGRERSGLEAESLALLRLFGGSRLEKEAPFLFARGIVESLRVIALLLREEKDAKSLPVESGAEYR